MRRRRQVGIAWKTRPIVLQPGSTALTHGSRCSEIALGPATRGLVTTLAGMAARRPSPGSIRAHARPPAEHRGAYDRASDRRGARRRPARAPRFRPRRPAVRRSHAARPRRRPRLRARIGGEPDAAALGDGDPRVPHRDAARRDRARTLGVRALDELPLGVVLGTATAVEDADEKLVALEAFTEKLLPGRWADARRADAKELKATTVLRLPLDEASAKIRTGVPTTATRPTRSSTSGRVTYPLVGAPRSTRSRIPTLRPGIAVRRACSAVPTARVSSRSDMTDDAGARFETVVMKFGGSSVADPRRSGLSRGGSWTRSARPPRRRHRLRDGEDDRLADRARRARSPPMPDPRELDMLLSTGERIACALVAMAIHDLGEEAVSLTGSQAGILTDAAHNKAKIREIRGDRIRSSLERGEDRPRRRVPGLLARHDGDHDARTRRHRRHRGRSRRRARRRLRDLLRRPPACSRPTRGSCRTPASCRSSRTRRCSRCRPRAPRC